MATETTPAGRTITVQLEAREFDWEFTPGQSIRGFGFGGQVPGPLLEAEVGDTLVVELTDRLDQPTTIHWHGLRLPAPMDGTEAVQRAVEPGESFEYRFVLPDAATFWYHSHVNETEQVERGLYGGLVVRGSEEPAVDGEQVLIFDDLKRESNNKVSFKIDTTTGMSMNTRMSYKAKKASLEQVLNDLADKNDFGWFVYSNPKDKNDRYNGWVIVRKGKGKERGYEAGTEPKK